MRMENDLQAKKKEDILEIIKTVVNSVKVAMVKT